MNAGAVVPALSTSKNAPTQVSSSGCSSRKSADEMGQVMVLEPHFTVTFTVVEQAEVSD